jgi:DNA-binding NtrC family response regulator
MAKILIVDDEVELKNVLVENLLAHSHEARGCASGKEALAALRVEKFDLLISDLMMAEMDGLALIKAALEIDPHMITIIMTGQGTNQSAEEAISLGVFDFLLKPFTMRTLIPILKRALDSRNPGIDQANPAVSSLGDLTTH